MNKYDSKSKQQVFINDRIRCRNSRVVDDGNGNQLGIMPAINAIEMAKSKNLDLMQIGFHEGIAICKMCNYGKFMYEQKQKAKEAKKKARANIQDLKEMSFSIRIDDNDKKTKLEHVKKFLADNCKVKLSIFFSKRELGHFDLGKDMLRSIVTALEGVAEFDTLPRAEGRQLFCIVKPKKA